MWYDDADFADQRADGGALNLVRLGACVCVCMCMCVYTGNAQGRVSYVRLCGCLRPRSNVRP